MSRALAAILKDAIAPKNTSAKVVSISAQVQPDSTSEDDYPRGPWIFYPELGPEPSRKDAARVYKNAISALRRALKNANIPLRYGLHSLRHTYATGLISAGVSPVYVQQQLGHADVGLTVKVYGSHFPVRVPGAVDTLADKLTGHGGHQMDTPATAARTGGGLSA
jgi:integrase